MAWHYRVVYVFLLPRSQDEEKEWDGFMNWSTVVRSGWWVSCMGQKRRQPLAIWHEWEIFTRFHFLQCKSSIPWFFCWVGRFIPNESSQEVLPTQPPFQAMDYDPQAGRWRNKSSRLKFESSGFWVFWCFCGPTKRLWQWWSQKKSWLLQTCTWRLCLPSHVEMAFLEKSFRVTLDPNPESALLVTRATTKKSSKKRKSHGLDLCGRIKMDLCSSKYVKLGWMWLKKIGLSSLSEGIDPKMDCFFHRGFAIHGTFLRKVINALFGGCENQPVFSP